ncbi:endolytic transglycosylase MltG [Cytophagaceae bacterium ABcell3]|nr:endolytic transglycosylase MltG [Cytophagaceae bacterium ABcell3]
MAGRKNKTKRARRRKKKTWVNSRKLKLWSAGLALLLFTIYFFIKTLFFSNIQLRSEKYMVYAHEDQPLTSLADSMKTKGILGNSFTLKTLAFITGRSSVHQGLYEVKNGWNNIQILFHLSRKPIRESVKVSVPIRKLRRNVLKVLCKDLSVTESDVVTLFQNEAFLKEYDPAFDKESVYGLFIAGDFYAYQDLTPEELFECLYNEYCLFWTPERIAKCEEAGLTPLEAGILASIVYAETKLEEEMPAIAGLYLNRLSSNMRLQADPTVVYAAGQANIRRVLKRHKKIQSSYNTYRVNGLPPGPVFTVPAKAIDAVLDYESHDYLFFCADPDMSGGHVFAETYEQHKENARKYQQKLNRMGIYR